MFLHKSKEDDHLFAISKLYELSGFELISSSDAFSISENGPSDELRSAIGGDGNTGITIIFL